MGVVLLIMRVLIVNERCGSGSTGKICVGIANALKANGHDVYIAYGVGTTVFENSYKITNSLEVVFHKIFSRIFDGQGLLSLIGTIRLIKYIKQLRPDVVNLHNLHGSYVNYPLLFKALEKTNSKVVWTLHDCWSFTGHCAHFYDCEKWKCQCNNCPYLSEYPKSYFIDRSKANFNRKKRLYTQLGNKITIVPVSRWLGSLVQESFFKDTHIEVIQNGIDTGIFKIIDKPSFKEKYELKGKFVLLGVASPWSQYKGLGDFFALRKMLSDRYVIVLVGLSEEQQKTMPPGIIGIGRTDSVDELVDIYNSADLFLNPTYQDTFPTVNLEAMACGTPVITYRTGGSPEAITEETGMVVPQGDVNAIYEAVISFELTKNNLKSNICRDNVLSHYEKGKQYKKYVNLFESLV